MQNNRVATAFMNGIGNFIFFTAAIKILKNWGYDKIDLLTDPRFLKNPALVDIAADHFESIRTEFDYNDYDRIFLAKWSEPMNLEEYASKLKGQRHLINWHSEGIHEVQAYLDMIGASWQDFDGYLLEPEKSPLLEPTGKFRIALANCSPHNLAVKKRWDKFPELSQVLTDLDYEVVLLGLEGELDGCVGHSFIDKLTIRQSANILSQVDLLICTSTCLGIVADAVGIPVLWINGPMPASKFHTLQSKNFFVQKYISCAPCWQKSLWNMCNNPICMNNIEIGDVIRAMFEFIPKSSGRHYVREFVNSPTHLSEPIVSNKRVLYLVACYNRYYRLVEFFNSFKDSHPMNGVVAVLDDASMDLRIGEFLRSLQIKDIDVVFMNTDISDKLERRAKYTVNDSIHAYNQLIDYALTVANHFDYVILMDPDIIMKPYWIQKTTKIYESVIKTHRHVGTFSPLNARNERYDYGKGDKVFEGKYGGCNLRKGANLPYGMSMEFLVRVHKKFDVNGNRSSDIGKSNELFSKGYLSIATVPSQVQHVGAFETSYNLTKTTLVAEDF
jgi:ADP-heptose:LPS heptosyltransferase